MAVSENLWNLLSGYMCVGFYILATERFLKYREAAQWPTIRKNTPTVQFMIIIYLKTGISQKEGENTKKNGPVLEAFPDLDLDIWTRFSVYSTRDAWHFPPGSRRSNYVKIYSALSLFSDLIGRQFANVFQLGRSTRTKHTDLKSTTNKYSYKC